MEDQITGQDQSVTKIVIGATRDDAGTIHVMRDWELLLALNALGRSDNPSPPSIDGAELEQLLLQLIAAMETSLAEIAEMMTRPALRSEIFLLPDQKVP